MLLVPVTLFLLLSLINHGQNAKILGVFPFPSISHQVVFQPIWKELSLRGHQVTVLTPNPLNDPELVNLTEIDVSHSYAILQEANNTLQNIITNDPMESLERFTKVMELILDVQLNHPKFVELLPTKNNSRTQQFDLILFEHFIISLVGLGHVFHAPIISVSSLHTSLTNYDAMGNPSHPVLYPDMLTGLDGRDMSFWDRLYSTYIAIQYRLYHRFKYLPENDRMMRKYFGDDLPYLGVLERNISMMFLNVNPVFHSVRPNVPAVIELGGLIHVKANQSLPHDLQEILDQAREGVIYISFGSNVKSVDMSDRLKQIIMQAVAELPYIFLWKWESDHMPGKPKNVITRKWLPQQDILAHPNIKAFLTQGGLQSLQESVSRGVPLIGMPFFGDQPANVLKIIELGIGLGIDKLTVTKDDLKNAIIEVAENRKYGNKVKELRDVINDQPMTPLEKTVFWSEYVIRHKGAPYLRSQTIDISWYQYLFLDIFGFIILISSLTIWITVKIVAYVRILAKINTKIKKS